ARLRGGRRHRSTRRHRRGGLAAAGIHTPTQLELGESRGPPLTPHARAGHRCAEAIPCSPRELTARLHSVDVRTDQLRDLRLAEALRVALERGKRVTKLAPNALLRRGIVGASRLADKAAQMLTLAHDLESEALGGSRGRMRRRAHHVWPGVREKELGNGDDPACLLVARFEAPQRRDESIALG